MKVEDLDVLRPEPRIVRIGGKDIDVSFVPCAITFEVDDLVTRMNKFEIIHDDETGMDQLKNPADAKEAFELSVRLCAVFCEHKYPELSYEWFMENSDGQQIRYFAESIKAALVRAYAGVSQPKNVNPIKRKKTSK